MLIKVYQQTTRVFLGVTEIKPNDQGMLKLPEIGESLIVSDKTFEVTAFSTTRNSTGEHAEAIVK